MSTFGTKLTDVAAANPKAGDKVLMVQDGQIKKAEIGSTDGMIPRIVGIPHINDLIAGGYLPANAEPNAHPVYIEGMLRYLVATCGTGGLYMGPLNMGSQGFYIAFLYNGVTNGLPSHCNGLFMRQGLPNVYTFNTINGVFNVK